MRTLLILLALCLPASAQTYFAEVDSNGVVLRVIVATQAFIDSGAVGPPSRWVETSDRPGPRKNFAHVGGTFDAQRNAFIAPKPFPSWTFNEARAQWVPPQAHPNDGNGYGWNESQQIWIRRQ